MCAGALTDSAVGQASIVRTNRIPAKSVPEGYATHTHTHSLSLARSLARSVEHVHIHISVCLSLPSPCARTHTKAYQSMHSSGSTTCTSAPLRRHTRQYTSNPFDFGQCTGMSAFSLSPTVHVPTDLFNCNYPEKKDAKKILNFENELPTSISKKAMHKLTDLYTPVPKIQ